MGIQHQVKRGAQIILAKSGLRLLTPTLERSYRSRYRAVVRELTATLIATTLPDLKLTEQRIESLSNLVGTNVGEGCFILDRLSKSLSSSKGDVCEFGVAQGATSALLAHELLHEDDRTLWLYDSFEGLPKPTGEDQLIDDVLGLGTIDRYAGAMAVPEGQVRSRLEAMKFPSGRVRIVKGFVTSQLDPARLPADIAFAYIDFDFYQPIADALALVHQRLSPDGYVIVDDYGFLSAGAQKATDQFIAHHKTEYDVEIAPTYCGHFAVLHHRAN